jgi:murein L,D-transpeptidase YcbB/YkuD
VVGTRREQTPMMAGLIRYVVLNPYWDVPVDLVRDVLAPKVVKAGPSYFESRHMQALSDWSDEAVQLDPRHIDWPAVAAGRVELRVRQRPGGDNMMGMVKFMLPNELGIYLHDTPDKAAFLGRERLLSSGCVRLERAPELMAWLFGDADPGDASAAADRRVDLPEPTPVYITYLTAAPSASGVTFYPDVYGRDPALLASLAEDARR